ncbi:DUF2948 family protein [Aureimonas fodinaquatilis]|uniref:DUF2948 family protein n=1 Tax=Aureimonas fodinaquatilis TaxID=2565783 RepID=A0A5B0DSH8_9HYPH|nr:DUF2948 family protein [Aureimonas fodinaquatilis]KAA0968962.1 DUF2948 family protein [Aureimonas fodinaquatilis]
MTDLRLMALDAEDLQIISAHCQDAVMKTKDLMFEPQAGRFVLQVNRFVWEDRARQGKWAFFQRRIRQRRRAVLHFDRVVRVQQQGVAAGSSDEVLDLLAIAFHETDAPSGTVELVFAGNATIRLEVECIEAQLTDLGAAWSTDSEPNHYLTNPAAKL